MSPPWGIVRELNAELYYQHGITIINVEHYNDLSWRVHYYNEDGTHYTLTLAAKNEQFPYNEAVAKLRLLAL